MSTRVALCYAQLSHTSDIKSDALVAAQLDASGFGVTARNGASLMWSSKSLRLICCFYLSVPASHTVSRDPFLRYILHFAGPLSNQEVKQRKKEEKKKQTNKKKKQRAKQTTKHARFTLHPKTELRQAHLLPLPPPLPSADPVAEQTKQLTASRPTDVLDFPVGHAQPS